MRKLLAFALFLGVLFVSSADASWVTSRSSGSFILRGSTSASDPVGLRFSSMTILDGYEQVDIVAVRVGSATQDMTAQANHYLVLIDSNTGTGGQETFNNCAEAYATDRLLSPPLFFASTNTATNGSTEGSRSHLYTFPPGTTVTNGLVACQQGLGTNQAAEFTIFFDIPRRRVAR